jgi:large subunit ribosomal protein L32
MSKHPVPKYKTPKAKTKTRYSSFKRKTITKLEGIVNLMDCPSCKQKKLAHHVCKNCGKYNNKKILDMEKVVEKITKVKA